MRRSILAGFILQSCACGGSSPSSPTPPAQQPPPTPPAWTISGTVRETRTGVPAPGAALDFSQLETVTADGEGRWTLRRTGTPASPIRTDIKADGYVDRRVHVQWQAGGRADVAIDMIRDAAPFSLAFFRQIARNDFDEPGALQQIRRWTTAPSFYLNAHNPRTGNSLLQRQIDVIVTTIRHVVPQITNGRFEAGSIEIGTGAREPQARVINIDIVYEPAENYCGRARVGAPMGQIWFNFERCAATCRGEEIGPEIVAHEVGHAMGLWHHGDRGIMNPFVTSATCASRDFSERERVHSDVMYSRPPGNTDPDWDPPSVLTVVSGDSPPTVICYRR